MEFDDLKLGEAIRAARIEIHLSQEDLAEKVNITPTHMKHIEGGHRKPSVEVLYKLLKSLNMSLDDLFFPSQNRESVVYRKADRLLKSCDNKQLRVLIAAMEVMLEDNDFRE